MSSNIQITRNGDYYYLWMLRTVMKDQKLQINKHYKGKEKKNGNRNLMAFNLNDYLIN